MQRITVSGPLEQMIKATTHPVELCDASGAVIAVAWPGDTADDPPLPTPQELSAMLAGPKYSTEQIVRELEGM